MTRPTIRRTAGLCLIAALLLAAGFLLRPVLLAPTPAAAPELFSDNEIGFIQDMAEHHGQAMIMVSRLDPGADPAVSALAGQIDAAQRVEFGTLLGWTRLAGRTLTNPEPMAWMHGDMHGDMQADMPASHHAAMPAQMPGMASADELTELGDARGADAEVLFLQLMLRHHEGGIAMATAADELLDSGPVKQSARSMVQEQNQESQLMQVLLAQRGAQPLPLD